MNNLLFSVKTTRPVLALLGLGLGLGLNACQIDVPTPQAVQAGDANFTRYIAVGNSLTAGYADDGLYLDGQLNSYPSILAGQFALAGGGAFAQPLFSTAQANGTGYIRLAGFTPTGSPITTRVTPQAIRAVSPAVLFTKYTDAINNLGVPGIRMSDIQTANYGTLTGSSNASNFNPYYERISATPGQSYLQRIQAEVPSATFFTCWLGNNDVLGYATAGGGANAITPTAAFDAQTQAVVAALTASGAKGVVINIPDVVGIPFFTTVGPSARASFAAANVPAAAPFVYTTGILAPGQPNTRVAGTLASIRDASGTGNLLLTLTSSPYIGLYGRPGGKYWRDFYQQARPSLPPTVPNLSVFLLTLAVDTTQNFGQSTGNPFPSTLVLDGTEQTAVLNATTAFNNSLASAAAAKNVAFFDANTFFRTVVNNGIATNGVSNTAGFISGNIFSLDGVHPTPRGYSLLANEMIKVINTKYGSTLPQVSGTNYRGVLFP